MMTFKEFMSATGVPERTLRRMIADSEIVPAQYNGKGKPSYFDEQNVADAKALYADLKPGKKSPTKAADNQNNDVEAAPVSELKIDLEFQQLIPPLSDNERAQLEENILRDGIQDPLKVWDGVIVDGHNRYSIAQKHGLTFKTTELHFDDRDAVKQWIVMNQFGRRNINRYSRGELALKLEATYTDRAKSNQGARNDLVATSETDKPVNTRDELAKIAGVSPRLLGTIKYLVDNSTEEIKIALRNDAFTINAAYEAVKAGAMTVEDVTEFKTRKEKPAPKSQHTEEPARPPVENPPTNDNDEAGKIFVGNKPIDSLKSIVVPDDDSEQNNTGALQTNENVLGVIQPASLSSTETNDSAPVTNEPTAKEFNLDDYRLFNLQELKGIRTLITATTDLLTVKQIHDLLLILAKEIGEVVLLVESRLGKLLSDDLKENLPATTDAGGKDTYDE